VECICTIVILLVIAGVVLLIANSSGSGTDRLNRSFFQLARRFNGSSKAGGWWSLPSVRFRYGESYVLVESVASGWGGRLIVVQMTFPDRELACHVAWGPASPAAGLVPVHLPESRLGPDYSIYGAGGVETRKFLSEGVQVQLDKLGHMLAGGYMELAVVGGILTVRKSYSGDKYEQIEQLVLVALDLLDQALITRAAGIEFTSGGHAVFTGEARCGVCQELCETQVVYCRRCRTPHHLECWTYNGACSVYGCRETEYFYPPDGK